MRKLLDYPHEPQHGIAQESKFLSLGHAIATEIAVVCAKVAGEPISVNEVERGAPIATPAASRSCAVTVPEAPATAATFWNTATHGGDSEPFRVAVWEALAESTRVTKVEAKG
jgi:hypothetical protein